MADEPERGVAYNFWLRVQSELADRGWSDVEFHRRTGVARTTVDNLRTGKPTRVTVNKIADALEIDRAEAHRLARGLPGALATGPVSAREAVRHDPKYTEEQRRHMLDLMDLFEQANEQSRREDRQAG